MRIVAAGDVHCREASREHVRDAFAALRGAADLVLLAGDLTTHGEPEQAEVLARACDEVDVPVLAVLGNHDWHADRVGELRSVLEEAPSTSRTWSSTATPTWAPSRAPSAPCRYTTSRSPCWAATSTSSS